MEHALHSIIAQHQESWIGFTKALIEIPTENPPGVAYRACVDLLAHKLTEIGLEYTLLEAPAPSSSHASSEPGYCLLSSYGVGENTLYFHGHYDVVPASDPAQFRPFLTGDKLSRHRPKADSVPYRAGSGALLDSFAGRAVFQRVQF